LALYGVNLTEYINPLCGQNAEFINVTKVVRIITTRLHAVVYVDNPYSEAENHLPSQETALIFFRIPCQFARS